MSKMLCRDYSDVYARRTHASRGVSSTSAPSRRSRSSDRSRAWIRDSRSHSLRSANRSPSRNSGSPLCRWTAAVSITENARSRSFFFMISPLPFRLLGVLSRARAFHCTIKCPLYHMDFILCLFRVLCTHFQFIFQKTVQCFGKCTSLPSFPLNGNLYFHTFLVVSFHLICYTE